MASGFFALFDDIAVLMDDMATMSKIATQKTAGILADDLAVNADKASGFVSDRELPILWKITKGSLLNKLIILPVVFLLSAFLPVAIVPILILGGLYLAYEGAEKIYEHFFHTEEEKAKNDDALHSDMTVEQVADYEKEKVKSAIFVDFILSIEIVIIALSTVTQESLTKQIIIVSFVALLATVFVYGLVALLVRMDDAGFSLIARSKNKDSFLAKIGGVLVKTLPYIVRALGVIGTIAMIMVAGGIFVHNIEYLHHLVESLPIPSIISEFIIGLLAGFVCLFLVKIVMKIVGKK